LWFDRIKVSGVKPGDVMKCSEGLRMLAEVHFSMIYKSGE
jgi:hypothetical protein